MKRVWLVLSLVLVFGMNVFANSLSDYDGTYVYEDEWQTFKFVLKASSDYVTEVDARGFTRTGHSGVIIEFFLYLSESKTLEFRGVNEKDELLIMTIELIDTNNIRMTFEEGTEPFYGANFYGFVGRILKRVR